MSNLNKWDRRFLSIAKEVSTWSKDPSSKIGAVITGNKGQVISQGYNGFPKNIQDLEFRYIDREVKYNLIIHAEMNAIYNALNNGASVDGCTMYVTGLPVCHECAKGLIQTGIKRVVMDTRPSGRWEASGMKSLAMFDEAGVEYHLIDEL